MTAPPPTIAIPIFDRNEVSVRSVFARLPELGAGVNSEPAVPGVGCKAPPRFWA